MYQLAFFLDSLYYLTFFSISTFHDSISLVFKPHNSQSSIRTNIGALRIWVALSNKAGLRSELYELVTLKNPMANKL